MSAERLIAGSGTDEAAWEREAALSAIPALPPCELLPSGRRIVVVAPHPDDEILGVGGILSMLCAADAGREVLTVAVTDGEASHSGRGEWTPRRLRRERPAETQAALRALGVPGEVLRLELPDGGIAAAETRLADRLAALLRPGDRVLTTWALDGHPDHEACARATLAAGARARARVLQFPVWGWHWARPADGAFPLARCVRVELDPAARARKRHALRAFRSQLEPDAVTGEGPILPPSALARFLRPFEVVLA